MNNPYQLLLHPVFTPVIAGSRKEFGLLHKRPTRVQLQLIKKPQFMRRGYVRGFLCVRSCRTRFILRACLRLLIFGEIWGGFWGCADVGYGFMELKQGNTLTVQLRSSSNS